MKKIIWISWENHRRTFELSKSLGSALIIEKSPLPTGLSHLHKFALTIKDIFIEKPDILFVQNPSVVLAFIASLGKIFFSYILIVDRHTNFRIGKPTGLNPVLMANMFFSKYSLKHADLTIVTNTFLKEFVNKRDGNGFILKDKLPSFKKLPKIKLKGASNIVFICTFANDEPYDKVIKAAMHLPETVVVYITGNNKGKIKNITTPKNVILTGYLPQQDYDQLLTSADVIMDFTDLEWCLVCGGYEAVALEKPFITSNTIALKELYGDSAIYTQHEPKDIATSINIALKDNKFFQKKVTMFKKTFSETWEKDFNKLQAIINTM